MAKITIIDGNDEIELSTAPKENIKAYMVKGEPGSDGVSPTITASRTGKVTTITMTDKNGTTSADINDGVSPTVTTSKVDRTTTMTITDIDGTRTTEIYDGIDLTGGVPTNGVIGFDTDELIYTCDGTETGDYYLTYEGIDYYFTMPTVEEDDVLIFNADTLTLSLDNTTISTSSSGTGAELTFDLNIPGGYEEVDVNDGLLKTKCIANAYDNTSTYSVGDFCIYDDVLYKCTTAVTSAEDFDSTKWSSTNVATEVSSVASITDSYSTSTTDGYSANYVNKLTADTGWLPLPLASGITAQSTSSAYTPQYRKIGNIVYIEGCVKGATANNTVLATLPEGFRPVHVMRYMTGRSGGANAVMGLSTNGELVVINFADGSAISAGSYIYIQTSFLAN